MKTTVIQASATDDALLRPSFLETSGWGRADDAADEPLISTKRPDQHSVTVTDDAQPVRPIVAASEAATSGQRSVLSNVFVQLAALLAAVLAIVAVIGRIVFRLSRRRPADRIKPGAETVSGVGPVLSQETRDAHAEERNRSIARRSDLSRDATGNAAVVADMEQSVRRLLHELGNRHLALHEGDLDRPERSHGL